MKYNSPRAGDIVMLKDGAYGPLIVQGVDSRLSVDVVLDALSFDNVGVTAKQSDVNLVICKDELDFLKEMRERIAKDNDVDVVAFMAGYTAARRYHIDADDHGIVHGIIEKML